MNVLLLYGGRSTEHEVSIRSARNIAAAIPANGYQIHYVGIDKHGVWHLKSSEQLQSEDVVRSDNETELALIPGKETGQLVVRGTQRSLGSIDVAFPIIHGTGGEDGTIQSMLKMLNIPFVGPGVMSSAICLDKEVTKQLLDHAGILNAPYLSYRIGERESIDVEHIVAELGLPLYVKPPNLGSSVGITRVSQANDLMKAIDHAFEFDRKVLIESNIDGRELECAVKGNHTIEAATVGEVQTNAQTHEFYDYDAKYEDAQGADIVIPAHIDEDAIDRIREVAIATYKCLNCEGMTRVDVFLRPNGDVYVNEVNTIPGFTDISMYPKLWEAVGISYSILIVELLDLAIERGNEEQRMRSSL